MLKTTELPLQPMGQLGEVCQHFYLDHFLIFEGFLMTVLVLQEEEQCLLFHQLLYQNKTR